jgi:hypothetical protein
MKSVTKGDTIGAEMIPTGQSEPKSFRLIGPVKVWALVAAESDEAAALGDIFEYRCPKKGLKIRMPARAP